MRKIKIVLEYDGFGFHGWQKQPDHASIQETVEKAFSKILSDSIDVVGSGRTDAGVHALGQVAHAVIPDRVENGELQKGLNSILPPQISIQSIFDVSADFHARKSALEKTYRYLILNDPIKPALDRERCWWFPKKLDVEAMREALQLLVGKRDFKSFQSSGSDVESTIRELKNVELAEINEMLQLLFTANGFLKQMVRNMVGTLVEVGRGKIAVSDIEGILQARDRREAGPTAPARGLYLLGVKYQ